MHTSADPQSSGCGLALACILCRVGQNHIFTVCIQYFWQIFYQMYGHIWRIYTVLANRYIYTVPFLIHPG